MAQSGKRDLEKFVVMANLYGADPATAANYGIFFTAPFPCVVESVSERHETASSSGTLQIAKVPAGTAKGSATNLLASTISTAATANTIRYGTLAGAASTPLAPGDSLALINGGTLTSSAGLAVAVTLRRV